MKISEEQRKEIWRLLDEGRALPDKYRFLLFDRRGDAELVWDGKSGEVCDVRLPFQTIEQVDEPRDESRVNSTPDFFDSGGRQLAGWTNKLIWGENKLVLSSLAAGEMRREIEDAGGLRLVYIDPPFDVGADFSMKIEIGGEEFVKEPNMLEEIAYRDTWGRRENSYIAMMYERLLLIHDLLAENGSIYVHCDWRVSGYMRLILDDVFGRDNFRNEISWRRQIVRGAKTNARFLPFNTDYIFLYTQSESAIWNKVVKIKFISIANAEEKYLKDEKGFFSHSDPGAYSNESLLRLHKEGRIHITQGGAAVVQDGVISTTKGQMRVKYYRERIGNKVKEETVADNLWDDISGMGIVSHEHLGYPTQKPEGLLRRIIKASSNEGDLVADFFCGSGTTAAVAEKLGRKWIAADLGKFAIHTTRKRLIGVQRQMKADEKDYRAFALLNLGRYERQYFVAANPRLSPEERESLAAKKWGDYVALILSAYHAQKTENDSVFHGKKSGKMVAVGPLNLPVSRAFAEQVVDECKKRNIVAADILAFEFEMGICPAVQDAAKQQGVALSLKYIPPEVFDKRAVEKSQVAFYDVAHIEIRAHVKKSKGGRAVAVELANFSTHYTQDPAKPGKVVVRDGQVYKTDKGGKAELLTKNWHDWVDYWAVDFDYESRPAAVRIQNENGETENRATGEFIFENEWQSFRTRQNRALELVSAEKEIPAKPVKIAVKVVDLFGNDTMKVLEV